MRQEIPNSSSCGYRIDGSCMDTCRAHRCVKKAHASFFPSSLSLSLSLSTSSCTYLMKYTLHKLTVLLTTISATSIKHKEWDPSLYYLFKKSTQLCPYEMGNILIFANNFL